MKTKGLIVGVGVLVACSVLGQNRDDFMRQQAYAEMQRVSGQVDVLQSNLGDIQQRLNRLEGGGDLQALRQEVEALKASVATMRREMQSQREEIVKDLSGRLSKIQPAAPRASERKIIIGPHVEYTVQSGDTLSLIAQAFNTPVAKIKEMNGLKSDNLRIGQKLNLPKK